MPFSVMDANELSRQGDTSLDLFARQVALRGNSCALRCGESSLSYLGLQHESDRLARLLLERGVVAGEAVALMLPRSIEIVVAMLAVQKIGGFYVPIDPALPDDRIDYLLSDCGAKLVVMKPGQSRSERLPAGQIVLLDQPAQEPSDAEPFQAASVGSRDRIYVIYTSGSTGRPKGAINFHGGALNLYRWFASELGLNAETRSLIIGSLSFDLYHKGVFAPLLAGGCVVLSEASVFDANALRALIERERIDLMCATPSAFYALIEEADERSWQQLQTLRVAALGGEALLKPRLRSWLLHPQCRTRVINTYGPTECADIQTYHWVGRDDLEGQASIPIGRPIDHCEVYVLDEQLRPVASGGSGVLWLGGICVGGGYLNLPEKTEESFRSNPFRPGEKMYNTGDLAAWRGDPAGAGVLEYRGRIDRQVKIRGYRIELDEVEAHLSALPQVQECAAIAPADASGERRLRAYVRLAGGHAQDQSALRRALAQRLPEYALPSAWTFLDAFPYNNSGKIDRKALPLGEATAAAAAPSGATLEQRLAGLWQELIGGSPIDWDVPFMEQGGTSLLAVRFIAQLSRLASVQVPVAELFAAPTVRLFSAYLRQQHAAAMLRWAGAEAPAQEAKKRGAERPVERAVPVAVIGMACRVPGADDVDTFWRNIRNGRDMLRKGAVGAAAQPDEVSVSGWIEDAECFDHAFFRFTPREAASIDPQQRILLECAWNALEHAGIAPGQSELRVGVYAGVAANSYLTRNLSGHAEFRDYGMDYASLGNDKDYCATRIAYKLDLRGPAINIQTGCSSSGTALHTACLALAAGDCDAALVGGAALPWRFRDGHQYVEDGPFSRDGRVCAFDANASGMVMSAGTVCVVLKRLDQALADGDTIYSVIRATAINNDGGQKAAFTAPNGVAQTTVVRRALQRAGVSAEQVSYIEAHGTGTPIGDPIEAAALTRAYRIDTDQRNFCALGSVKGVIGHLDAGAACAGLVKMSLALSYRRLPPQPHFSKANPECRLEDSPFYVNAEECEWQSAGPRRAALSSFGFGGTNFHAVLEEAPPLPPRQESKRWQLLRLSAKTPEALQLQAQRLETWRLDHPSADLADVAFTLDTGRARFAERGIIVTDDAIEAARLVRGRTLAAPAGTVWMFPGQGTQYSGMGQALYEAAPVFRQALDRCAAILSDSLGRDLLSLLFDRGREAAARLRDTAVAQPAIFSFSYALAQVWLARGLQPQALVGHSIGEFAAAVVAGVFTLEDALPLIALRGALMSQRPAGSMLAVRDSEEMLRPLLTGAVDLAAVNAPRLCVVSGPLETIDALRQDLAQRGIAGSLLHTSHAFHSSMMDAVVEPFGKAVAALSLQAPRIPIMSTVSGEWLGAEQATDPGYWARQLRLPVRFADAVQRLAQTPGRIFLEVGPGQSLTAAARQSLAQAQAEVVASQAPASDAADESEQLEVAAGRLWITGIELAPQEDGQRRRIGLPGYPFNRVRHWIEPVAAVEARSAFAESSLAAKTPGAAPVANEAGRAKLAALITRCSGMSLSATDWEHSFLELGFDSLLLAQLSSQIKQAYSADLRFRQLLKELATPRALAEYLERSAGASKPAAPVVLRQSAAAKAVASPAAAPPCEGARLGRDPEGNPAWFVPCPQGTGAYVQVSA